jgi:hypothetical protein
VRATFSLPLRGADLAFETRSQRRRKEVAHGFSRGPLPFALRKRRKNFNAIFLQNHNNYQDLAEVAGLKFP